MAPRGIVMNGNQQGHTALSPPSPSTLCDLCKGITFEGVKASGTVQNLHTGYGTRSVCNDDDGYIHHQNMQALAESAMRGCQLCRILSLNFKNRVDNRFNIRPNSGIPNVPFRIASLYSAKPDQLPGLLLKSGSDIVAELGLHVRSDTSKTLKDVLPGRQVAPDPMSDQGLKKIKRWLRTCDVDHDRCSSNSTVRLPTRVVEINPLRLKVRGNQEDRGKFVALSHCWGGVTSSMTTKATLVDRTRGINFSELPQNFQDAILVTRKLGIQYLWIDSLCIVQDDSEDWEREAAQMIDVYRNSFLTIAAMSAVNSNEGFLHRRGAAVRTSCEIPFGRSQSQSQGSVSVCWPHSKIGPDVLATRGWTLQELILPSRVLHFSAEQMIWDCERQEREDGLSPTISGYNGARVRAQLRSGQDLLSSQFARWYALVENYSSRNFTEPMDKLPAISGLARETQEATSDEYLAGLWRQDLAAGLMWAPSENGKLGIPSQYRGPSWSWVAVDGPISYQAVLQGGSQEFDLDIKQAVVTVEGSNQLGIVENGYIVVNCLLKECLVGKKNVFGLHDFEDQMGEFLPDDGGDAQGEVIWCMKVISKEYDGASTTQIYPHGLALQHVGDMARKYFRRIGTFKLSPGWDWFACCEKMIITIS